MLPEVLDRVQQNIEFTVSDDARDFLTLVQQAQGHRHGMG